MATRSDFARSIATIDLSHADRAIALLWFYRQTQQYDERTAGELAIDLHEEGFPKPNVSPLHSALQTGRYTVRGIRPRSFQLDLRRLDDLESRYGSLLETKKIKVEDTVIPQAWFSGTRVYLERLVHQINGSYQYGFYDACAALARRLMESLLIEVYVNKKRHQEIQNNGVFMSLDKLITYIRNDPMISLGRGTPKTMIEVKQLGDTAAHDRVYVTEQMDLDDIKARYRRMIQELMSMAGIQN